MRTHDLLIDRERVATDERRNVTDPYSGEVIGHVAVATREHAERAVTAAARGLAEGWAQADRAAALERARALVVERAADLARSIAEEAGKPLTTARAEAARCADTLLYAALEARALAGAVVPFEGTLQPTVLDHVAQDMRVSREEVFGPVLAVQPARDMATAVRLANDSRYGLNAGVFTADYRTALDTARALPTFRADQMPYGGVKDSGNTREGPPWSVADYLDEKLVVLS